MPLALLKFHAFLDEKNPVNRIPRIEGERLPRSNRRDLLWILAGTVLLATILRLIFFEGLWGSDDFAHVHFATSWDHKPANHHEARLFYNALLRLAILAFGRNELAYAIPSLLASAILVASSIWCAGCLGGRRAMLIAGLIAATMPVDVIYATVPAAGSLSAGLAAVGTMLLLIKSRPYAMIIACLILALSILAHMIAIFYVGALICGLLFAARTWQERKQAVVCGFAVFLLFAIFELTLFTAIAGDPFYEFRTIKQTHLQNIYLHSSSTYSLWWFIWPIKAWLFSKDFGLTLCIVSVLALLSWRHLSPPLKAITVTLIVFWLWLGYGTQKPTGYLPFHRVARFGHMLTMPVAVLLGSLLARRGVIGVFSTMAIGGMGILLVASSGSWGQKVEITREFLPYIRAHPHTLFLAGASAQYQLFILNQCEEIPNVAVWDEIPADGDRPVAILLNPLNSEQPPERLKFGTALHVTQPTYRSIATLLPEALVQTHPWFVRRPPGQIVQLAKEESVR